MYVAHNAFYRSHHISPPSELFNALTDTYYFAKNLDGQFVFANKLLSERFSLDTPSNVFLKTDFDFFRADVAEHIRRDDLSVMRSGQPIRQKLEILNDGNDAPLWLITTKSPLYNLYGEIVGIEGLSIDASKTQTRFESYDAFKTSVGFIQKHFMQRIKIEQLASLSNMSLSTFERQFKRHLGSTPSQYIKKVRIQEACGMLLQGMSIPAVASACGFCDQSYFGKEFKGVMGMTPKRYVLSREV